LGLVYAACLREVGDPALAEDAALSVFLVLARRAPSLRGGTGLAGWLFQTARLAARNARRTENRRRGREQEVAERMHHEQGEVDADIWEATAPRLNDALASLGAADRECVLLRFFEGQSLAEVGAWLGVSENTARMRVARAVEKMRRRLDAEGVVPAAPALAALLLERAASPAPDSCVAAALLLPLPGAAALSLGPTNVRPALLAQGVLHIMAIKTAATVAVSAVVALVLIGGGVMIKRHQDWAASQMAYTRLPMAHGTDNRRPIMARREMISYSATRQTQEDIEGMRRHLPLGNYLQNGVATDKALSDEIKRVEDSRYSKSFDKDAVERDIRATTR